MKATTKMRQLLEAQSFVHLGPSFDCLSAAVARDAGFKALHISGMCVEATQLGCPDMGLSTMTEFANHVAHITNTTDLPCIADIDTGWGNVVNLQRTIHEMERAGLAGVHLEDQPTPKKCPAMDGRSVVSRSEAVGKIKAALSARSDPDFIIIARSDADTVSYDELIYRLNLYLDAGADAVMHGGIVELTKGLPPAQQMDILARVARNVHGPLMGVWIPRGYTVKDMAEAGYKMYLSASETFIAAYFAMKEVIKETFEKGTCIDYMAKHHPGFDYDTWIVPMWDTLGYQKFIEIEKDFQAECRKEY